jgi:hypothetical protein
MRNPMRPSKSLFAVALFVAGVHCAAAQITFQTRDLIRLTVSARPGRDGDSTFLFSYRLSNSDQAQQSVWKFLIAPSRSLRIENVKGPPNWNTSLFQDDTTIIKWFAEAEDDVDEFRDEVKPGDSRSGFSYETASLPGIVTYYSEGWADPPQFEEGMATDSIPGYSDLTPYGPGIVGKTVGPMVPPEPFDALAFLDTLLSYTTQSKTLGWIRDQTTADKYLGYFSAVKLGLSDSNFTSARNTLKQVLHDVDVASTSALTSEAYALLRFNTEYLVGQLTLTLPPSKR